MQIPADVRPGTYHLRTRILDPQTGRASELPNAEATIVIDPDTPLAIETPRPELDLSQQLRQLAAHMPEGFEALDRAFLEIGRINQYDPVQGYATHAQKMLTHRLYQEPDNLDFAYNLVLTAILQRDARGAIAALEPVVQLDPKNPHARAYLAFVQLYNFHPKAAQATLKPALEAAPELPEIQGLSALAALMQGNVLQTWKHLRILRSQLSDAP